MLRLASQFGIRMVDLVNSYYCSYLPIWLQAEPPENTQYDISDISQKETAGG